MVILNGPEKNYKRIDDSYTYVNTFIVVHGEKTYTKRWVEVLLRDRIWRDLDWTRHSRKGMVPKRPHYTAVSVRRPWCAYELSCRLTVNRLMLHRLRSLLMMRRRIDFMQCLQKQKQW